MKTWKATQYPDPVHSNRSIVHDTGVTGTDSASVQEAAKDADGWFRDAELPVIYSLEYRT